MLPGVLRGGRRTASKLRSTRFAFICSSPATWPTRTFAQAASPQGNGAAEPIAGFVPPHGRRRLKRVKLKRIWTPSKPQNARDQKRASFLDDLDACLPPSLRKNAHQAANGLADQPFDPNIPRLAKLLLSHQAWADIDEGLLAHLAVYQERWRAVVWIVKQLLEHYSQPSPRSTRLSHTTDLWKSPDFLDDLTHDPLVLDSEDRSPESAYIKASTTLSLDDLTSDKPEDLSSIERLRHDTLGVVWQGIGEMIIACVENPDIAAGEVKPEILEMIAMLHHHELMPSSIYTYLPSESDDAIQQPPTLHLLSARILTALSDAAWRAHETSIVEEAKRPGAQNYASRPELPGSSYRIRVSGVKPEIWLELILWSCLHGGWIQQGADVLRDICFLGDEEPWRPISWRDCLRAIMPFGQSDLLDWDAIKHMYDTRLQSTMDGVDITGLRVDKTVSSEVVNAYVDALLNIMNLGVGSRGLALNKVFSHLHRLQHFLRTQALNLGGGSWDAILLRMVESGGLNLDQGADVVPRLTQLSPTIGEEARSQRSQNLPPYVLDGSAAILGMLHRSLHVQTQKGNLEGALQVFRVLQERVDEDRHRSLVDFFNKRPHGSSTPQDIFTSNFSGIDYPAFNTQIPTTTLAALLELVTTHKAYEFGKWLLYNNDVDGPMIPESMYTDEALTPALIRFATAMDDMDLLSRIVRSRTQQSGDSGQRLPRHVLQAFLDAQIDMGRWDAAQRILEYMRHTPEYNPNAKNAAIMVNAILRTSGHPEQMDKNTSKGSARPGDLLVTTLQGGYYGSAMQKDSAIFSQFNTLAVVTAAINSSWADFAFSRLTIARFFPFKLTPFVFNSVLEGATSTYGSSAGQRLVQTFWEWPSDSADPDSRSTDMIDSDSGISSAEIARMPRFLQNEPISRRRSVIALPPSQDGLETQRRVAMYGWLHPDFATFKTIYEKALKEYKEGSIARDEILESLSWTLRSLRRLRLRRKEVWDAIWVALSPEEVKMLKEMNPSRVAVDEDGEERVGVFAEEVDGDATADREWLTSLRERV